MLLLLKACIFLVGVKACIFLRDGDMDLLRLGGAIVRPRLAPASMCEQPRPPGWIEPQTLPVLVHQ